MRLPQSGQKVTKNVILVNLMCLRFLTLFSRGTRHPQAMGITSPPHPLPLPLKFPPPERLCRGPIYGMDTHNIL